MLRLIQIEAKKGDNTITNSELTDWAKKLEIQTHRFPSQIQQTNDVSHPAISVNLDACIQSVYLQLLDLDKNKRENDIEVIRKAVELAS